MVCANYLCIYWNKNECILDRISIDAHGNCEECIYIDMGEEQMEIARKKALEKYGE